MYLQALPVGESFRKDKLTKNYTTLILNTPKGVDYHRINIKYTVVGDQEELDMWNACESDEQYEEYLKKYPRNYRYFLWHRDCLGIISVFLYWRVAMACRTKKTQMI